MLILLCGLFLFRVSGVLALSRQDFQCDLATQPNTEHVFHTDGLTTTKCQTFYG